MEKLFQKSIFSTKINTADVRKKELLLGYFIGPLCALIPNAIFGSYLNRYYSDVIGWTDAVRFGKFSAILPVISVIFVVIGNLLVGHLIDNTVTSQGKARPYLLISAPLLVIAMIFLFCDPSSASPVVQMIWITISYNLYYAVTYPFYYTAHSSMVSLSTRNSKQRGLLATFSNASGVAAIGIGASILIPVLLQSFLFVEKNGVIDTAESYQHWRILMIVLCLVTFTGIVIEYYFTRERITEEDQKLGIKEEKIPMKQQVKVCMTNGYWWMIILYFVLFQFGGMMKNGSMSYYCRWVFDSVGNESAAGAAMSTLGLIGGIPTAIGMLVAWPIAKKLGKRTSIMIGMILSVAGGMVSFLDTGSLVIVCIGVVLKGIGSIPGMYVTLALLSDVLDHLEAKNGFRSDGFTMSVYGAIMVGMTGLGNGLINALLSISGYDPGLKVQSTAVKGTLIFSYLGAELICYAVIVLLMISLNVEKYVEKDQKKIMEAKKEKVLASGGEWIDPAERMKMEEK